MEIQSVFGGVAKQGSLPYRITIRNNSGRPRVWTVRLSEGNYGRRLNTAATFSIEVEDGAQAVREVTLPFAPAFLAYDYRNLEITVSAPGLPTETRTFGEQTPQSFPMLAMSKALAQRSPLPPRRPRQKRELRQSSFRQAFDPAQLPSDWLGYTGLDGLILDEPAWKALTSAQRQALVAWIRLGGRLDLYGGKEIDPASLDLPLSDRVEKTSAGPSASGASISTPGTGARCRKTTSPSSQDSAGFGIPRQGLRPQMEAVRRLRDQGINPLLVFLLLLVFSDPRGPGEPLLPREARTPSPAFHHDADHLRVDLSPHRPDHLLHRRHRRKRPARRPRRSPAGRKREPPLRHPGTTEPHRRHGQSRFDPGRIYDLNPVNLPASQFNPFSTRVKRTATYVMTAGPLFR